MQQASRLGHQDKVVMEAAAADEHVLDGTEQVVKLRGEV
jgi:hypothetical protein